MAGIGFELKKLFSKRGVLANLRAYGYATVVCTGPMLLSIALLLGVRFVAIRSGATGLERELLNSMITYTLLASLTVSGILSMITTRYTADMLYEGKKERVLPSMYGNIAISSVAGCIAYGVFLLFSGIEPVHRLLCFILFAELVVVWVQINYLTAVKDYRNILIVFCISVFITLVSGFLLHWAGFAVISALMTAVIIGYGVMMSGYFVMLHRYFPQGEGSAFAFLAWIDKYPHLLFIGLFITIGMFGHLVIMWTSPVRVQVKGLFYGAPTYDVPALIAFLSILITTVNFVTSVEVNFYPRYREYFRLFNGKGTLSDVQRAQDEMFTVLREELYYLALRQVFATVIFIVILGPVLIRINIGFTEAMMGTFRILCAGYAFYAIANSMMLVQLYFADNMGAFVSSLVFMMVSCAGTVALMYGDYQYYGFGFLLGGLAMYLGAWIRMTAFCRKLDYHVLCSQPVLLQEQRGFFTRIADFLEQNAKAGNRRKQREDKNETNKMGGPMSETVRQ